VAAMAVTVLLLRRSILTEKLARRGQHIAREYSVDVLELTRVGDVMDKNPPQVEGATSVAALSDAIARGDAAVARRQAALVTDGQGRLAGIITRGDIMRALDPRRAETGTVLQAATTDLVVTYPDETLHMATVRMLNRDIGRLPVVARDDPTKILGYLGRADILAAQARRHQEEERRERGPLIGRSPRGGAS